jgi:pyrroline-5-carboxylate reductase
MCIDADTPDTIYPSAQSRLGIVGATGWLGQGLGLNLLERGLMVPGDLVLLNRSGPSAAYAKFPGVIWARDMAGMQDLCDTIVLSVRPEDFPVAGFAPGKRLVISFMAGVPMDRLAALAPLARLVRAMPNGGATTGNSYTPWLAQGLDTADQARVRQILSAIGREDRVETEDHLDILTALSGSGPAYPALLARALLRVGLELGLPQPIAARAVEAVVAGSAAGLVGGAERADEILAAMLSYRGITAAGLAAAEAGGFDRAIRAAITAATAKARSMGREEA